MCKTSILRYGTGIIPCLYNFSLPKYRQDPGPVIFFRIRIIPKRSGSGIPDGQPCFPTKPPEQNIKLLGTVPICQRKCVIFWLKKPPLVISVIGTVRYRYVWVPYRYLLMYLFSYFKRYICKFQVILCQPDPKQVGRQLPIFRIWVLIGQIFSDPGLQH